MESGIPQSRSNGSLILTLSAALVLPPRFCREGRRGTAGQYVHEINSSGCGSLGGASEHGALVMALQFQVFKFRVLCSVAAAAVAGSLVVGAGDAWSQAAGAFSALGGSWSGGGSIKKASGGSERIRCRATYTPSGSNLSLRMRCASDSYNIDLSASVNSSGGSLSGSWQEATRGVGGGLSGSVSNGGASVQAVASGPVTSNITLHTSGGHQSVLILTPGAEVPEVTVSLNK